MPKGLKGLDKTKCTLDDEAEVRYQLLDHPNPKRGKIIIGVEVTSSREDVKNKVIRRFEGTEISPIEMKEGIITTCHKITSRSEKSKWEY